MVIPSILICDSNGKPHSWAHWQDSVRLKYLDQISYEMGENHYTFNGGTSRMTGVKTQITIPSIIFVKSNFNRKYKTPALTAANLFQRDRYTCSYCGRFCKGDTATIDHVIPTSRGGKHTWTNVVCSCKSCNNRKDSKMLHEIDMKLIWVPYTPSTEEALILKNRNILFDQANFLINFISDSNSRVKESLRILHGYEFE